MSNPENLNPISTLVVTGNPKVDAIIRYALGFILTGVTGGIFGWLSAHGFSDPQLNLFISTMVASTLAAIALAAWGVFRSSKVEAIARIREAIGVQAGINLAISGEAITIPTPQGTVAKPVTLETAQQIIQDHASPITVK